MSQTILMVLMFLMVSVNFAWAGVGPSLRGYRELRDKYKEIETLLKPDSPLPDSIFSSQIVVKYKHSNIEIPSIN